MNNTNKLCCKVSVTIFENSLLFMSFIFSCWKLKESLIQNWNGLVSVRFLFHHWFQCLKVSQVFPSFHFQMKIQERKKRFVHYKVLLHSLDSSTGNVFFQWCFEEHVWCSGESSFLPSAGLEFYSSPKSIYKSYRMCYWWFSPFSKGFPPSTLVFHLLEENQHFQIPIWPW